MRPPLFHASVYDYDHPVPSYWEATGPAPNLDDQPLTGDQACDVTVIGGGYTGLSAALHLARGYDVDVRVLEAGHIGWGASGRNGGFCCLPAAKMSVQKMTRRFGLNETKRFFAAQLEGMDLVRALGKDEGIDFDIAGDGNLEVAHHPSRFEDLVEWGKTLTALFGISTKVYSRDEFKEVGHDSTEQFGALHIAAGFGLHPLKFAVGLGEAARRHGAKLHPHSFVHDWSRANDGRHILSTSCGSIRSKYVILTANGFTPDGLHPQFNARVLPALSNIITTRPLTKEELAAHSWHTDNPICNTRNLLFYYRLLPDRSFLFGARGDTTGRPEHGKAMKSWMIRRLGEVFPSWREIEVSHFWRGLVCVTQKRTPSLGRLEDDPTVLYGYGYHANGVNTAPWVGRLLAQLIAGRHNSEDSIPRVMTGQPQRFPFAALRLWYLRAAYLYYRFQDSR